ncbi:MAG TPA: AAA family ATPase [Myxococcota bacterium]|nr:AAA family ATPase [Myxococcota bacterium]
MLPQPPSERSPLRALNSALGGGLRLGEVGLVSGKAGVGKSALLVQLALERLLRQEPVLDEALRYGAQHVRDQYESILEGTLRSMRPLDRAEALLQVERCRIIHAARDGAFSADRLHTLLATLADVVDFRPVLVVIDGWDPQPADIEALRADPVRGFACWVAFTPVDVAFPANFPGDVLLEVVPERTHLRLVPHRVRDQTGMLPLRLDGAQYVAPAEERSGRQIKPEECTLFTGGAAGAEAAFGELAERWGVKETNFTFRGHVQAHSRGAVPLTEAELAAGDVSLAYVARKLRRSFGENTMLRRVLQSLWHQVSRAEQVFVIGTIQEDGTVTGGTGWAVELARMWNKRLWVFDQEKDSWYLWNGEDWVVGTPTVDATNYCGTGSRNLTEGAFRALEGLMERSFGPRDSV